jgi:cell division inhibitor SulA/protein ImuA
MEILVSRFGSGELNLLLPVLAMLTGRPSARWCAWVTPPLEPFAPALLAHGVVLDRVLIIRAPTVMWAFEQSLGSGACDAAIAWARRPRAREIRRLQLAAERGRTLGVLFRPASAAQESSPAILRLILEPAAQGLRVTFLKSRGGARGSIDVACRMAGN